MRCNNISLRVAEQVCRPHALGLLAIYAILRCSISRSRANCVGKITYDDQLRDMFLSRVTAACTSQRGNMVGLCVRG